MKKLAQVLCITIALGGCAQLQNAYNVITGASVSPAAVYVAENSFDAIEVTATNYLRQPKCTTAGPALCRSPAATRQIIPAIKSGRASRDALKKFLADNPGQLGPTGLYNALTSATSTLQAIMQQYGVTQ